MANPEQPELPQEGRQAGAEGAEEDWETSPALGVTDAPPEEMAAYARTLRRVERLTVAAGVTCSAAAAWPFGWAVAAGMIVGTGLGWVNFRWLAASVNEIGERVVKGASSERGAAVVVRGVGRIFLIAIVAYGIFTCSVRGLVGFLAGLAMPVLALMCEAAYEFVASNGRSS
jgi:hypothetical protein